MSLSKRKYQEMQDTAYWHFTHCTLEYESDPENGASAWCIEHNIDVSGLLPDYDYESSSEFEEAITKNTIG